MEVKTLPKMDPRTTWKKGKQVPAFQGKTNVNPAFNFDTIAGRCIVLMFHGSATIEKNRSCLENIYGSLRSQFDDKNAIFFAVSIDPRDPSTGVKDLLPGIRIFWDFDLNISKLFGAVQTEEQTGGSGSIIYRSFTLLLDSRLRVHDFIEMNSPEEHNRRLQSSLEELIAEEISRKQWVNAPVLIVPNVFPKDFCSRLIALYEENGGSPSGTMTVKDGKTVGKMDRSLKRRLDHYIEDVAIIGEYGNHLEENLFPQVQAAFNFNPTHIERYIIACYDGEDNGFFAAHRDHTSPGTAHRQFAITINLNSDEYEGGDLRFPEYSINTYRAPTGGAVVFSGAILHEVLPVTKGRRYATLPFIHNNAAEEIRIRNRSNISKEIVYADKDSREYHLGDSDG